MIPIPEIRHSPCAHDAPVFLPRPEDALRVRLDVCGDHVRRGYGAHMTFGKDHSEGGVAVTIFGFVPEMVLPFSKGSVFGCGAFEVGRDTARRLGHSGEEQAVDFERVRGGASPFLEVEGVQPSDAGHI